MRTNLLQVASALMLLFQTPAGAQSLFDSAAVRGLSSGAGAGAAAGVTNGAKKAYQSLTGGMSAAELSKNIDAKLQAASQAEKSHDLEAAEAALRNALSLVARRDGPGSTKSVPVLARLVNVLSAANKLEDAISFQKTVVTFAQVDKGRHPAALVSAQRQLADLYLSHNDLDIAEVTARQSWELAQSDPSISAEQKAAARKTYALILREMNHNADADKIESSESAVLSGGKAAP